jgi:hypothetical protein
MLIVRCLYVILQADLRALLAFSDVVNRLESLLLIPTATALPGSFARSTADASSSRSQHDVARRATGLPHEDDADLVKRISRTHRSMDEQTKGHESSSEDELDTHISDASYSVLDRRGILKAGRQPEAVPGAATQKQLHHSGRNLDLPTRIARAKTTWESLNFLRRAAAKLPAHAKNAQIASIGSASSPSRSSGQLPFLESHEQRLSAIEGTLKGDLRSLFSRLMTPGALLVAIDETAGLVSNPNSVGDLDRWSRIAPGLSQPDALSDKFVERKAWMMMLLETWTSIGTDIESSIGEIQDHLSEKFVRPWCRDFVRLDRDVRDSLSRTSTSSSPRHTQEDGPPQLLQSDDKHDMNAFVSMFNMIIRFVHSMRELTALLESFDPDGRLHGNCSTTLLTSGKVHASGQKRLNRIQPFEAVIWSRISTALTEQVGERLFYVGAPDEFHRVSISSTGLPSNVT